MTGTTVVKTLENKITILIDKFFFFTNFENSRVLFDNRRVFDPRPDA